MHVESSALPSNAHKMAFELPLEEIAAVGAENGKSWALFDVGVVEISPLLLALNE